MRTALLLVPGLALVAGALPGVGGAAEAAPSPDKIAMVAAAPTAKVGDVVIANADGTHQKVIRKGRLSQAPWYAAVAAVDNRVLEVFGDGSHENAPSSLAVMNADGSAFRVLAKGTPSADLSLARWNATGTKILVSVVTGTSGYLAEVDPGAAHPRLVKVKGSTGLTDASFATTSDSTLVATDESGAIVTLHGGATTLVLDPPADGFLDSPVFAPGDATIAFSAFAVAGSTPVSRIETVSADGTVGPTAIVASGVNLLPSWSSDGATLLYNAFTMSTGASKVYAVPAAGGTPTAVPLTAGKGYLLGSVAARDTTAPGAPAVRVSLDGATPTVSWTLPPDPDVSHVVVRRLDGTSAPASPGDGDPVYRGAARSVTDDVTLGSTYTYAVWVVDGAGNVSPPATRTFTALAAPTLHAPALVSSTSLDTTFRVAWTAAGNPSDTAYTVQWRVSGGTWATWRKGVPAGSGRFGLAAVPVASVAGTAYGLRAFATDAYGNTSARAVGTSVEPVDDTVARTHGSWHVITSAEDWLGTAHGTTQHGASLAIGLTGSRLWIIGDRLPAGSLAVVYVDGVRVSTIDTHGSTAHRRVLWTHAVRAGHHALRIVNLASRGRSHLDVDAFAAR